MTSKMTSADYPEGYWERGEGSNYTNYGDEIAWPVIWDVMAPYIKGAVREIACAKGWFVRHGYYRGYDVKGIDISEYAIEHHAPGVGDVVEQANAVDLPWGTEEAQVIFAFEFLEHVYEDEIDAVLAEIDRVAKPDGLIVFKIGLAEMEDHCEDDHTHYTQRNRQWWEYKLSEMPWERNTDVERLIDEHVSEVQPSWSGRWFVYVR